MLCACGSGRTILSETIESEPARPGRSRSSFFPRTQTRLCYLAWLTEELQSPPWSREANTVSVLYQPQPGLAPAASPQSSSFLRRVPAPQLIAGLWSEFDSSLILTQLGCTMVIENSIRTRLSEIVNLNLFKSSENNNVRKSSQSKHNQKLVANPSEETFVSNQSTAKLLKVINIIIN